MSVCVNYVLSRLFDSSIMSKYNANFWERSKKKKKKRNQCVRLLNIMATSILFIKRCFPWIHCLWLRMFQSICACACVYMSLCLMWLVCVSVCPERSLLGSVSMKIHKSQNKESNTTAAKLIPLLHLVNENSHRANLTKGVIQNWTKNIYICEMEKKTLRLYPVCDVKIWIWHLQDLRWKDQLRETTNKQYIYYMICQYVVIFSKMS